MAGRKLGSMVTRSDLCAANQNRGSMRLALLDLWKQTDPMTLDCKKNLNEQPFTLVQGP